MTAPDFDDLTPPPVVVPVTEPRRFARIIRNVDSRTGIHTIDAIDEDGRAWCLVLRDEDAPIGWFELQKLPSREDRP